MWFSWSICDLGSDSSLLSLLGCGFPGKEGTLSPWLWKDIMLVIYVSSVHTQAFILMCNGKTDLKTEVLVSRSPEHCFPLSDLSYKCYK